MPLLVAALTSVTVTALSLLLRLPSLFLLHLHTYIHPDSLPPGSAPRAAIRPPSSAPRSRHRPKPSPFDESTAQLFRLRLADSHLHSRLLFPLYRSAFLSSLFALSFLASSLLFTPASLTAPHSPLPEYSPDYPDPGYSPELTAESSPDSADAFSTESVPQFPEVGFSAVSAGAVVTTAVVYLLFCLVKAAVEPSASKLSEKQLGVLSGFLGSLISLLILYYPAVFDIRVKGFGPLVVGVSGCVAGVMFVPSARAGRSFWLGTDQLRWNLSVVSCGVVSRMLLYVALLLGLFAPMLWVKVLTEVGVGWEREIEEWRVWVMVAAAVGQVLVVRANLQMYLNEAVLCWYQRLHSSRAPDLDYGRAKVFLHNHYLCVALIQFMVPPVLVLMLLGVSRLRGNLFGGVVFVDSFADYSDSVKEIAMFMAWWIMFVRAVLIMASLAIYRCGFLLVS